MTEFIIPLGSAGAVDAERVGPKAANLAALAQAGLPTPGGFCLSADAYRAQIAALGGRDPARPLRATDRARNPRAAARGLARCAKNERRAERGALLRPDRGSERRQFRRPVRELSRHR